MRFHGLNRLPEPESHRQAAKVELQRFHDLLVTKLEHPVALFDHRYFGAEGGKNRGVLDADDAGPDDDERPGDLAEPQDAVGVEDVHVVECHSRWPGRPRARGDDHVVGAEPPVA